MNESGEIYKIVYEIWAFLRPLSSSISNFHKIYVVSFSNLQKLDFNILISTNITN